MLNDTAIAALAAAGMIDPFDPARVQPASYDLALGRGFLVPQPDYTGQLQFGMDLRVHNPRDFMVLDEGGEHLLHPGRSVLATTRERLAIPIDIAARVEGKSSIGRLFLAIHCTSGFVDPLFSGEITLEIVNHGIWPVLLYEGMLIAQANFIRLATPAERGYGSALLNSHYQHQRGPTASVGRRGDGF